MRNCLPWVTVVAALLLEAASAPQGGDLASGCGDSRYTAAIDDLKRGQDSKAAQDFPAVNSFAKTGIAALGEDYNAKPGVIDDTAMYLQSADMLEHDGHLQDAALERLSMLRSRIAMYDQSRDCGAKQAPHVTVLHQAPTPDPDR